MFNSIIKDKNRRNRFKKAEIKSLQSKSICSKFGDLKDHVLFNNFIKLVSANDLTEKSNRLAQSKYSKTINTTDLTHEHLNEKNIDLQKDKINKQYLFWLQKSFKSGKSNPRNCSITQIKNRCVISGRARSILRFCRLSRIVLRDKASRGLIPGASKASW
uniref:30S ribosomal protein S14 n=1 Tax=Jaagichlorella hainangensis TaxID=445995 RepID=A0A6M8U8Z0_9CHLO|nr:30S ribosomal protein S14 [Jaagichlorella hainangensis]QKJ84917.1 30S ribosomal protein S14 [Jaagichlorella hainangensis]